MREYWDRARRARRPPRPDRRRQRRDHARDPRPRARALSSCAQRRRSVDGDVPIAPVGASAYELVPTALRRAQRRAALPAAPAATAHARGAIAPVRDVAAAVLARGAERRRVRQPSAPRARRRASAPVAPAAARAHARPARPPPGTVCRRTPICAPTPPTSTSCAPPRCAWSTANASTTASRRSRRTRACSRAARRHTAEHGLPTATSTHIGPRRRHAADPHPRRRLPLQRPRSATKSARTSPGARCSWPRRARSWRPGWPRRSTARTSSTARYRDTALGVSAARARLARRRPGGRHLHRRTSASTVRLRHAGAHAPGVWPLQRARITSAHRNTTRRSNSYGSTRRQVGDRHGLGARDRPRDRGAARRHRARRS